MAEVFMAAREGRLLALKRILAEFADDPVFVRMFLDEVSIAGRLSHPNICSVFDSGQVDGRPFLVMEFVPGVNLWALIARGHPLPVEIPVAIASKIAAALAHAHAATDDQGRALGIVHRDVTPNNVMVSFDGGVKLLDFGIAKARVRAERTRTGVLKGKYAYMSPEQAAGGELDARSDLFSLGLVLYESLTGARPFGGTTPSEIVDALKECAPRSPVVLRPDLDPRLAEIILRALARRPEDRFESAEAMAAALESFLEEGGRPLSDEQLGSLMKDLFPQRHRAIKQVEDEVRSAIESGGGRADDGRANAPSVPFEEHADDMHSVALSVDSSGRKGVPTTTMAMAHKRRRRGLWKMLAIFLGFGLGLCSGVALWSLLRPPRDATAPAPVVRQLTEDER